MAANNKNVLVADDRPGIRKLLEEILATHGCSVKTVNDGREALEAVQEEEFGLVLLDLKMSGIDGLETMERMKETLPHLEIIIMTAYEELDVLEEAQKRGANGFLSKPFDIEDLLKILDN